MKTNFNQNNFLTKAITSFCLSICLAVVQPVFSAGVNNKEIAVSEKDPGDKSPAKKARQARNKTLVRVYPDMLKRIMHVVAKENEEMGNEVTRQAPG